MRLRTALLGSILAATASVSCSRAADTPAVKFPLKVSHNHRYLVDAAGKPFFVHGDSPWEISWQLTRDEAIELLDNRLAKGFNTILVDVPPYTEWSDHRSQANRYGHRAFLNPDDLTTPDPEYFNHIEWLVREFHKRGMLAMLLCADLGYNAHMWYPHYVSSGIEKCERYGRYLGTRFRAHDNIVWVLGGDRDPGKVLEHVQAMARGLVASAPKQLRTYHAGAKSSGQFFQKEPWFDINMSYGYRDPYIFVLEDYNMRPTKPCFLGESGYEGEANDGRPGTPHRVRRQAYWAILSGDCGHLYGSAAWNVKPELWRKWLDSPGAQQMAYFGRFFQGVAWYKLVPDQTRQVLIAGSGKFGGTDYATLAYVPGESLAIAYMPSARSITIDLGRLQGPVAARWFDPTSGRFQRAADNTLPRSGRHEFAPPGKNASGDSDWVLILDKPNRAKEL